MSGTFESWITARIHIPGANPKTGTTGGFESWITSRVFLQVYAEALTTTLDPGVPEADEHVGNWTTHLGAATGLHEQIDEEPYDDDDYIRSEESPSASPYVCKVSTISDAAFVAYRYGRNTDSERIDLLVELREGYVSEGSPGTLIDSWTHTDIPSTFTAAQQTIGGTITDPADLYLRFVASVG